MTRRLLIAGVIANLLWLLAITGLMVAPGVLAQTGANTFQRVRITSTVADALDVAGGINAGTGNVSIVGTDGRIPALSSTELANLSGANLTALNGSNISTGTVAMARLSTSGVCSGSTFLRGDQACSTPTVGTLVSGVVVFAAGPGCPAGFTEFTGARGRVIVGLPLSGTNQGTVGTALTDLQNKTHIHTAGTLAGPSHDHSAGNQTTGAPSATTTVGSTDVCGSGCTSVTVPTSTHTHGVPSYTTGLGGTGAVTGSSGTAATSDTISYIQLIACVSD